VREFVEHDDDEIVQGAVVVVQPEVEVEVAAEVSDDVRLTGNEVDAGALVGERRVIPGLGERRAWERADAREVGDDTDC